MPKISAAGGPSDATTGLGMPTDDPETAVIETEATEAGEATPELAPQQAPVDEPGPEMSPDERAATAEQVEAHTPGTDTVEPAEGATVEPGEPLEANDADLAEGPAGTVGGWSDEPAAQEQPAGEEPGTVGPEGETMAAGEPEPES